MPGSTSRPILAATACALGLCAVLAACGSKARPAQEPVILVMGDSLSAAYGMRPEEGWVALLEARLAQSRQKALVVNASVSGETTAGGKARFAELLSKHKPTHVVIELGANDALRGQPLGAAEANLASMGQDAGKAGAKVLMLGMLIPPSYGGAFAGRFGAVFAGAAKQSKAELVPFLLAGVSDVPESATLLLPDGLHPNAAAQPRILENVWPALSKLLE